jgi:hypothetical protein
MYFIKHNHFSFNKYLNSVLNYVFLEIVLVLNHRHRILRFVLGVMFSVCWDSSIKDI